MQSGAGRTEPHRQRTGNDFTDADGVPTPPFKRGVMRVQEIYSPGKASAETSPTKEKLTVKHGQASSTQRGARMVFESTLDGLATRNTAGSGRGA